MAKSQRVATIDRQRISSHRAEAQFSFSEDFALLRRLVRADGLLAPDPLYYCYKIPCAVALLVIGAWLLPRTDSFGWQMALAAYFAVVFTQMSFFVHDAGHQQISRKRWVNGLIGTLTANLLLGMSYSWWCYSHNRHHKNPNQPDLDPDIDIPVLAFYRDQISQRYGLARFIVKYQHILFFPLMSLGAISKRRGAILFLARMRFQYRWAEIALVVVHYAVYFTFVSAFLGLERGAVFIAVHQLLYGLYMTTCFAPNHKGRPIVDVKEPQDYLYHQTVTSRNLISYRFVDYWYAGLNYQIEHHLFPRIPRSRLRRARALIRPFCKERAIPYYETGFLRTYWEILQYMADASRPLRSGAE